MDITDKVVNESDLFDIVVNQNNNKFIELNLVHIRTQNCY